MSLRISLATIKAALDGMTQGRYTISPSATQGSVHVEIDGKPYRVALMTDAAPRADSNGHPLLEIQLQKNALGFAALKNHADTLLEIAEAALALGPELVYLIGARSERLRDALAKVRP